MPYLCSECSLDHVLRSFAQPGASTRLCVLCGCSAPNAVDLELRQSRELLRALLRFHFDEWQYNGHLGGDHIEVLLSRENPIFKHTNAEGVFDLCEEAYTSGYETAELGISLFAGYLDGHQLPPLLALRNAEAPVLADIRTRLRNENHFRLVPTLEKRLAALRLRIEKTLGSAALFRARIGFHARGTHWETGQRAYIPYSHASLLAPPPPSATAGRINRAGVSFLYAASTRETAVAEVRPHPSHIVSTGALKLEAPLLMADFSRISLASFASSDNGLDDFVFLRSIERDFATPIVPDERVRYLLGQLVTDVLRQMGFDGVVYRSSIAQGINYCFFEPEQLSYVDGSASVHQISKIDYSMDELSSVPELDKEHYVAG